MDRLYLDTCCLNRPFDDQAQLRVRFEAEAVATILGQVGSDVEWVSSEVIVQEVLQNPDIERRRRTLALVRRAPTTLVVGAGDLARAQVLEAAGLRGLDALHLACAERAAVDAFLTTDDALVRLAHRPETSALVLVVNPLDWLLSR